MLTKYILGALAIVFLVLAAGPTGSGTARPQRTTWLIIGTLFAVVSAWLFYQEQG
jgi:hypothetical protein